MTLRPATAETLSASNSTVTALLPGFHAARIAVVWIAITPSRILPIRRLYRTDFQTNSL